MIELNFHKCKWLLCTAYRTPSQNHNYFLDNIDKCLDVYSTYERVALAGDFNAQVGEKSFDTFLYQHELTFINRYPTCYKNPNNPCCIDDILTNSPMSLFKTETVFTGLSDFHKLVLSVTETKLDDSFPKPQFCVDGFSISYRLDRNRNEGGLMIYVRQDIPSKMLTKNNLPGDIEVAFIELNFLKCKWLLCATYLAPSQNHNYFFDNIDKCLDVYSTFERVALAGDFNAKLYQHELTSINRYATCYKNPNNPSWIDHILTNSPMSFFKTETAFTGISDFHELFLSVFKLHFSKAKAKAML